MTRSGQAAASAAAGALLWGTLGPVAALFGTGDRIAAGGIRLAIGALVLLAVAKGRPLRGMARGGRAVDAGPPAAGGQPAQSGAGRVAPWSRTDLRPLAGGAVGIAGFQIAYFGAITSAGVAVSTAVGIGLSPVFTGLWTAIRDRRQPNAGWIVGTAVAVGGLCLLAFATTSVTFSLAGLGLSVLAAAFFSLQAVSIQELTQRHDDATALTGIFALGAVLMTPVIIGTATAKLLTPQGIAGIAYLGVVTTGMSYWLFARGIRHIGAAAAVTITLLEPAAAAVIAALLLHETLSTGQWAGIVLIGVAITITGRTSRSTAEPELSSAAAGS
ncbi:DMT family transporter [Kutzneria kofuensis]|uniref:DME family drug/metabolite transporter n=1 Tax=Kutzneria kofuensis TaxID=103725 RepID=A0A7W9KCN2_9PSEU|nr:EamA family transporter [Kutzneria kofuensis]MBB5889369.1 DME family drug/metabolite transporter [Kutzneria kofuensis]